MVLKRVTPSYRSRGTKQTYSDLNPMTEAKLKQASRAKYRRHATINHTNINNRRLAEGTHLNASKHKVLSPIHRRTDSQTTRTINPVDDIRNRTLHGSNPKPLPGISPKERGHTINNSFRYIDELSYLNPQTASKLERSRSMMRDKNGQLDQSYLNLNPNTANKLKPSRYMKRDTHEQLDHHRVSAPSNNKPLPQLNNNNNKLLPFKFSSARVNKKRDSDDTIVPEKEVIFTIPEEPETTNQQSQQSDGARLRKPPSVFLSKVNNFVHLRPTTADDFRGYNGCPAPPISRTKRCEGDDSFEQQEKVKKKNIQQLECRSKPLGKWYPLPEIIGKNKKQGDGQIVSYNLNKANSEGDDKQTYVSYSLDKDEKKPDEIPIPQPTSREQTYEYRYSSAGPSWSGKTHKEAAVSQCRGEVMAQNGGWVDPYKDNLNLSNCYQDPRYETTSLTEGMRPFRVRKFIAKADNGNYLLPMKRLYAPWKVNTEFGRYVTDTLHPHWTDDPRYRRKVIFQLQPGFGNQ